MSNARQLIFVLVAILILGGLFIGTSMKRERFECACGNFKEVVTTTIFFVPALEKEENVTALPFHPKHVHNWFWLKTDKRAALSLLINGAP